MILNKTTVALIFIVLVTIGAGYYFVRNHTFKTAIPSQITSFEECSWAGYPILQTYPEQCKTPDGKTFTKQNSQPLQSGITGFVLLGPTCPVERIPPVPGCSDRPFQTDLTVTTPDGITVVQAFSSDVNGKFSVALQPGEYVIQSIATAKIHPRCSSQGTIQVTVDTFTETTVRCDTGIR